MIYLTTEKHQKFWMFAGRERDVCYLVREADNYFSKDVCEEVAVVRLLSIWFSRSGRFRIIAKRAQ